MLDGILWLIIQVASGFYNLVYAITHPSLWLDWSDKQSLIRFIYYGGSQEFFFVIFAVLIVLTAVGVSRRIILWQVVRCFEAIGNVVGRIAAWAGLLMVLQQIMIIFVQRIFTQSEISVGFGTSFSAEISWWAEELKFFNALVVALCVSYAFIQGSHVRVDLFYAGVSRRSKKIIDMMGAFFFMLPIAIVTWMYAWFFMWRHLITPKVSASDKLELMLRKARIVKWNVETISFSPSGFNAYFLFKVLICAFVALVFIQALAIFYRSLLELIEGEESDAKYHDADGNSDQNTEIQAQH